MAAHLVVEMVVTTVVSSVEMQVGLMEHHLAEQMVGMTAEMKVVDQAEMTVDKLADQLVDMKVELTVDYTADKMAKLKVVSKVVYWAVEMAGSLVEKMVGSTV